jgi:purine catabolism regulator
MSKTNEQTTIKVDAFKLRAFPIIANRRCYGFLVAIKEIDKWREIDDAAMEHAITIFAIEYLKLAAVEETQIRLRGEFLEELTNRNFKDKASALEQGKKLGFDLSLKQAVFHIRLPENDKDLDILQERMKHAMAKFPRQYIFHRKRDAFLLLVEVKSQKPHVKSECNEIAAELQKKWLAKFPKSPLTIGIGKPYQDVHKLGDSAREAKYAVEFSPLLLIKKDIIHYEDLGAFHLLIQMKETGLNLNGFYEEHIGQLIERSKQGMDLVHTLEIFFKNNQGIQPTANELFVHRHTLKYRLNQIQNKTGFDLSCADERMKLQLAILAYKLEKFYENNRKGG